MFRTITVPVFIGLRVDIEHVLQAIRCMDRPLPLSLLYSSSTVPVTWSLQRLQNALAWSNGISFSRLTGLRVRAALRWIHYRYTWRIFNPFKLAVITLKCLAGFVTVYFHLHSALWSVLVETIDGCLRFAKTIVAEIKHVYVLCHLCVYVTTTLLEGHRCSRKFVTGYVCGRRWLLTTGGII